MPEIKAIETVYAGYKFRSRLEARWAVFFDTLGIEYKYEHQDYMINGRRYLPDFWLPQQECWFEVKGDKKSVADNHNLYQQFGEQVGPLSVFTDLNIDTPGTKYILCDHESNGGTAYGDVEWYFCPQYNFQLSLRCSYRCTVFTDFYNSTIGVCNDCDVEEKTKHNPLHFGLTAAYTAARQARFEHGEGNTRAPKYYY